MSSLARSRGLAASCLCGVALFMGCGGGEPDEPPPDGGGSAPPEVPFTAVGHEPEWRLEVTAPEMTLVTDLGETRLVVPTPEVERVGTERRYVGSSSEGTLTVTVSDEICSDSMTGMPFPKRVSVETGDGALDGCGGRPEDLLEGGVWTVEDLSGVVPEAGDAITLGFEEGRVAGNTSCNEYGADYGLSGEGLRIGEIISTRRACDDAVMAQERRFLALLGQVTRFSVHTDGGLVLHTPVGDSLVARR